MEREARLVEQWVGLTEERNGLSVYAILCVCVSAYLCVCVNMCTQNTKLVSISSSSQGRQMSQKNALWVYFCTADLFSLSSLSFI